jgi:beta-carotene 3-hydroxylase
MECVTWLTQIRDAWMVWYFHEDHHQPNTLMFLNVMISFLIIFAVPSIVLFYYGVGGINYLFFIGLGITYGFFTS